MAETDHSQCNGVTTMNKKQRFSNRETARKLATVARNRVLMQHTCENCGEKGGHWISTRGMSLQAILTGHDDQEGFWVCQKLYDDNGRLSSTKVPERTTGEH
jgi:hypothetical protein